MPSSRTLLAALAAASATTVSAAMGPAYSTGPVAEDNYIIESTATLVLPKARSGSTGDTSLWVGMGMSNGDLIQSIADNWSSSQWGIFAYTLVSTSPTSQMPVQDEPTDANAGDRVTMHYTLQESTGNWTQSVLINGKEVSTLSTSNGAHGLGWGTAVECAAEDCGTVPAHTWEDIKITMKQRDTSYVNTFVKGEGVTGGLSTYDYGETWVSDRIAIPEFTF